MVDLLASGYDARRHVTAIRDSLGNRIEYALDNAGNRTAQNVNDPSGALARNLAPKQTTGRK